MSQILNQFGTLLPRLIECFRHAGGIPYSEFRPQFTKRMDEVWRRINDEQLHPIWGRGWYCWKGMRLR